MMTVIGGKPRFAALLMMLGLLPGQAVAAQAQEQPPEPLTIHVEKGQYLSLITPVMKTGGEAAVKEYYSRAFPLARSFGLQNLGTVKVKQTIIGEFDAPAFSFFTWPDEASEKAFTSHPDWPALKNLRPLGWDELRVYSKEVEEDITLSFHKDKYYTVAVAWLNPDRPNDYDAYMDGVADMVAAVGGRFMFKMKKPQFEAHAITNLAPGQITLVEWPDAESLSSMLSSDSYKTVSPLFRSGVTRFEFHEVSAGSSGS